MIESLTDNFLKKLIDADTYQSSKKRYESKREHLNNSINQYEHQKDDWLEKVEKIFTFAVEARSAIQTGHRDTKRKILVALGKDFSARREVFPGG